MTTYHPHGVKLSQGQKQKLAKAYATNSPVTIRLTHSELSGNDQLMLTKTQINKLIKSSRSGKGSDIKISKNQIRKAVVEGGSLWSSLFSLGTKLLPYATRAASKAIPALATGAISQLGSLGIDKLFGSKKGSGQTGGFMIPNNNLPQLLSLGNLLTKGQLSQIMSKLQSGGDVVIRPTKAQTGRGIASILASIGIPLAIEAIRKLTGKGLHVESSRPRRSLDVHVPIGYGMKKKKTKGKGLLLGKNSPFNSIPILGTIL